MKALIYYGPHEIGIEERERPQIKHPDDAIIKMEYSTICGTDLHVVKGKVPTAAKGRILGHEGVGIICDLGSAVSSFSIGQRVLISCNTSCARCTNCRRGLLGQCSTGGWVLGNISDGCQAEYVRIPYADSSLYSLPKDLDPKTSVMLSDILPTSYELGIKAGNLSPGQSIAIIGAGPVGLATILTSKFYSPSKIITVDVNEHRLKTSLSLGAHHAINNHNNDAAEQILELTNGRGVDVAVECIGLPVGFEICEKIVCGGGNIAMLGVHAESVTLHLEEMWKKNFTFTAGLVHTSSIPMLMQAVQDRRIDPNGLISHHFSLGEILKAYDTFSNASTHSALKVILHNDL